MSIMDRIMNHGVGTNVGKGKIVVAGGENSKEVWTYEDSLEECSRHRCTG